MASQVGRSVQKKVIAARDATVGWPSQVLVLPSGGIVAGETKEET